MRYMFGFNGSRYSSQTVVTEIPGGWLVSRLAKYLFGQGCAIHTSMTKVDDQYHSTNPADFRLIGEEEIIP